MKRIIHNLLITLLFTASPLGLAEGKTNLPNAFALRPPAEAPPPQTPPPQTPDTTPPITAPSLKPPTSPEPPADAPSAPFVMPTAPAPYIQPAPPKTPVLPKENTPPPTPQPQAIQPPPVQYIDLTSPENTGGIPRMDMPTIKQPGTDVPAITLTLPENERSYAGWHNPPEPPVNHLQALFSKNNTTTTEQTAATNNKPRRKTKVRSEPAPLILPKNYIGEIPPILFLLPTSQDAAQIATASAFRRASSAQNHDALAHFDFNQNSAAVDPEKRVIIETPNARRIATTTAINIGKAAGETIAEWTTPYGAYKDASEAENPSEVGLAILGVIPAARVARVFNKLDNLGDAASAGFKAGDHAIDNANAAKKVAEEAAEKSRKIEADLQWAKKQAEKSEKNERNDLNQKPEGLYDYKTRAAYARSHLKGRPRTEGNIAILDIVQRNGTYLKSLVGYSKKNKRTQWI